MKREQIDEILHDKLYNMEPETGGAPSWGKFEPRLKRKATTTRYLPYAAVVSAAAAAIALIVVLTNSPQSPSPAPITEPLTAQVTPAATVTPEGDNTPAVVTTTPRTRSWTVDFTTEPVPKPLDPIPIPPDSTPAPDPADPQPTQGPQQPQEADNWERVNWRSSLEIAPERERKNRKISLLAYSNITTGNKGIDGVSTKYSNIAQTSLLQLVGNRQDIINFKDSDMTHKIPITFGVSVSIPLNDKFAIESGLTYTYLESTAEINKGFRYKYTQKIEYLGIPISATYKFIDTRVADVYGSVGVMGEVALSATSKTEVFDLFHSESENNNITASGVQFSANAAIGVNMHLSKNIGIYFEPGISNYLKNSNQPSTARTQSAFQLNMRAGFKIQL